MEYDWIEEALSAVSDEAPAGSDPRSDISPTSDYYRLKDLRMAARNAERNAMIDEEPISLYSSQWRPFVEDVPGILANQSKDLEYTAWLIEALTRLDGFKGMSIGYDIAAELVETYWESLYPLMDEDGVEGRVSSIVGLNGIESEGTLVFPMASIPLSSDRCDVQFSFWEYEQAVKLEKLDEEKRRKKVDMGALDMEQLNRSVKSTSDAFYKDLIEQISNAKASFDKFSSTLDSYAQEMMPSSYISKKLDSILSALKHLLGVRFEALIRDEQQSAEAYSESEIETSEAVTSIPENKLVTQLETREQAIEQLQKIADFFRDTEPHSPISYTIEQTIRWSGMSLPDLLAELISDGDAKQGYFKLVGIANQND